MKGLVTRVARRILGDAPELSMTDAVEAAPPTQAPPSDPPFGSLVQASDLWRAVQRDWGLLDDADSMHAAGERMVVDDPFPAVNIANHLRERARYEPARLIAEKILEAFPEYPFALFEIAVIDQRRRRNREALPWAERASRAASDNVPIRVQYAYLLGATGEATRGLHELNQMTPLHAGDHDLLLYAIQYLRFIERFPHEAADAAARRMEASGRYLDAPGVRDHIMSAIRERRPYAWVRINDGEGAWTFADPVDEAQYSNLFAANRRNFMVDWFGTDQWLTSPEWHNFARKLGDVVAACDLVALGEHRRLFDEYDMIGTRGLAGQVNHLRKLGFMDEVDHPWTIAPDARFGSSHVHVDLHHLGFYRELMKVDAPFGVITSYKGLPDVMRAAGATVDHAFFVPGDSRNFWTDEAGEPLRQWPDIFESVAAQLRSLDLTGKVFIMSAGFVGKQYLPILKAQGAVALDVGSMTNQWMERGAVE